MQRLAGVITEGEYHTQTKGITEAEKAPTYLKEPDDIALFNAMTMLEEGANWPDKLKNFKNNLKKGAISVALLSALFSCNSIKDQEKDQLADAIRTENFVNKQELSDAARGYQIYELYEENKEVMDKLAQSNQSVKTIVDLAQDLKVKSAAKDGKFYTAVGKTYKKQYEEAVEAVGQYKNQVATKFKGF